MSKFSKSIKKKLEKTSVQLDKTERTRGSYCGLNNELSKEVIELKAKQKLLSEMSGETKFNKSLIVFGLFLVFNTLLMWIPVFGFKSTLIK